MGYSTITRHKRTKNYLFAQKKFFVHLWLYNGWINWNVWRSTTFLADGNSLTGVYINKVNHETDFKSERSLNLYTRFQPNRKLWCLVFVSSYEPLFIILRLLNLLCTNWVIYRNGQHDKTAFYIYTSVQIQIPEKLLAITTQPNITSYVNIFYYILLKLYNKQLTNNATVNTHVVQTVTKIFLSILSIILLKVLCHNSC